MNCALMGEPGPKHQCELFAREQWIHVRRENKKVDVPFPANRHHKLKKIYCLKLQQFGYSEKFEKQLKELDVLVSDATAFEKCWQKAGLD